MINHFSIYAILTFLFLLLIFYIFVIYSQYVFYTKRHFRIISVRRPFIIIISNLILFIFIGIVWLQVLTSFFNNCAGVYFLTLASVSSYFTGFMIRAFVVYCDFQREAEAEHLTIGFFSTHRFDSISRVIGYVIFLFSLNVAGFLALSLTDNAAFTHTEDLHLYDDKCENVSILAVVLYTEIIIGACFIVFFAYMIRKNEEVFFIKKEFLRLALLGIIGGTVWMLMLVIDPISHFDHNSFPILACWHTICVLIASSITTLYPVHQLNITKSFRNDYNINNTAIPENNSDIAIPLKDIPTLDEILKSDIFSRMFKDHLIAEFAVECYFFLKAVDVLYQRIKSSQQNDASTFHSDVTKIFSTYISIEAPYEVNISQKDLNQFKAQLKKIEDLKLSDYEFGQTILAEDIFHDIYFSILYMLRAGPYLRFIETEPFIKALNQKVEVELS